ncbi:MAG: NUDIX hydrolase [Candidatus Saccharibacteria bacterium]
MIIKKLVGKLIYICIYPLFRLYIYNSDRAYVLLVYKNEIVLSQNWLGLHDEWALPGGGMHNGEDPKVAVAREVYEELNIDIIPSALTKLGGKSYRSRFANNYQIYKYNFRTRPRITINTEILQAKFVSIKDVKKIKLNETTAKALTLAKMEMLT